MWSLIAILLILITFIYYYLKRNFNYWKLRNVSGPEPVLLFGNIKDSALRRKPLPIVLKEIYEKYANEKIVGIYKMTCPCLLIRDLDIVKQVMIKDYDVFDSRGIEFSKDWYGDNMFHADGETWRQLRQVLGPIFTLSKLKNMIYLVVDRADKFIETIDRTCREQPQQSINKLFRQYTIEVLSSCLFGSNLEDLGDIPDAIRKINDKALKVNYFNELDMIFPGILKFLTGTIFPGEAVSIFNAIIKNVIKQRDGKPSGRNDLIDMILDFKQKGTIQRAKMHEHDHREPLELTDSVIAAQAFVFFLAGHETSMLLMSYMLHQLAFNPDIQEKLIAEVDGVLEKYKGEVTFDAVGEVPYMEKVFNETLRIYSISDHLYRAAKQDYQIPNTNVLIKKGQTVLASMYGIHNDERYFPNPKKFDPERFSPESVKSRHSYAFIPFGSGPRQCIGKGFSKIVSRVCMLKFFSKFRVEVPEKAREEIEFHPMQTILTPRDGITLKIIPRTL